MQPCLEPYNGSVRIGTEVELKPENTILHNDYPENRCLASNTASQRIKMNENFKDGINSGHFKELYFMQAAITSKDSNILPFNYL